MKISVLNFAIFASIVFAGLSAHAVRFEKCVAKSMKSADGKHKSTRSFTKWLNRITLQTSVSASFSTTSFVSSIGDCGAFAVFKVREQFIAENFDQIREESARGEGEYLAALASLSGCDSQLAQEKFQSVVRAKFSNLYFPSEAFLQPDQLGRQVDNVIQSDSTLNHMCQFKG